VTPRHQDVLAKVVGWLFIIAWIGLLLLFGRGYHTGVLVLIGVMVVLSVLTFRYDRYYTLLGVALCVTIGLLSLFVQGYHTGVVALGLTGLGIGTLVFLAYEGRHLWAWWFPDEAFGPTVKRWIRYLLQTVTAALAYVQARFYINELTGVDPGNFPTALAALTALGTLTLWLVVLPYVLLLMAGMSVLAAGWAGIRGKLGQTELGGLSARPWRLRAGGAVAMALLMGLLFLLLAATPFVQRAVRIVASNVLVATEFSYDQTCAVSSKDRLVALLKYRREMTTSLVSIAEGRPLRETRFTTGTCDQAIEP
jgi:hypothetical protein